MTIALTDTVFGTRFVVRKMGLRNRLAVFQDSCGDTPAGTTCYFSCAFSVPAPDVAGSACSRDYTGVDNVDSCLPAR